MRIYTFFFAILFAQAAFAEVLNVGGHAFPLAQASSAADIPANSLRLSANGQLYYLGGGKTASLAAEIPANSLRMMDASGQLYYFNLLFGAIMGRPDTCYGTTDYWTGSVCAQCSGEGVIPDPSHSGCICDNANKYYGEAGACVKETASCNPGDYFDTTKNACQNCPYQYYSTGMTSGAGNTGAADANGVMPNGCVSCSKHSKMYWNSAHNACYSCADTEGAICSDNGRTEVRLVYLGFDCVNYAIQNQVLKKCELRCPGDNQYWNGATCVPCAGIVNATHTACNATGQPFVCPAAIARDKCAAIGGQVWGNCSCNWDGCAVMNDTTGEMSCYRTGVTTTEQSCQNMKLLPAGYSSCNMREIPLI